MSDGTNNRVWLGREVEWHGGDQDEINELREYEESYYVTERYGDDLLVRRWMGSAGITDYGTSWDEWLCLAVGVILSVLLVGQSIIMDLLGRGEFGAASSGGTDVASPPSNEQANAEGVYTDYNGGGEGELEGDLVERAGECKTQDDGKSSHGKVEFPGNDDQ